MYFGDDDHAEIIRRLPVSVEKFEPSLVETPILISQSGTARHTHEAVDFYATRYRPQFREHFTLESASNWTEN